VAQNIFLSGMRAKLILKTDFRSNPCFNKLAHYI